MTFSFATSPASQTLLLTPALMIWRSPVAVAASSPSPLWKVMSLVDDFRRASGLGVNTDKTKILCARQTDLTASIKSCPWPDVQVAPDYTYLGVLLGQQVTVKRVFAKALTGLTDRATCYAPAMKQLSHMHRVITFNVFIFTKISYLIKFYILPYTKRALACAEGVIEEVARRLVIRTTNAYPYFHLISPLKIASPGTPLRDAWATSIAMLAAQADLTRWDGVAQTISHDDEWSESMRMSTHVTAAGSDFVSYVLGELPPDAVFRAADHTFASSHKQRSHMYDILVYGGYKDDVDYDIERKLKRRGLTHCEELVEVVHHNFSLMPATTPPHYRSTQFDLLMNSLMTERRCRHWGGRALGPIFSASDSPPCFICGKGQDSQQHLFGGECEPVTLALMAYVRAAAARARALQGVTGKVPKNVLRDVPGNPPAEINNNNNNNNNKKQASNTDETPAPGSGKSSRVSGQLNNNNNNNNNN